MMKRILLAGLVLCGSLGAETLQNLAGDGRLDALRPRVTKQNIDSQDEEGKTMLIRAAENGQVDTARFLVSLGANAAAKDRSGSTALHYAVIAQDAALVRLLASRPGTLEAENNAGERPVDLAERAGYEGIRDLLRASGSAPRVWSSLTLWMYAVYFVISISLTIWVARTLSKNGRIFLVDAFSGDESLADSVNHLLVVGFYLINTGYVTLALRESRKPFSAEEMLETLSVKVGLVLLILGAMHFFNMFVFSRMRKRRLRQELPA